MKAERGKKSQKAATGLPALLAVARGDEPADLVLANGQVVNVFTGQVARANVAVKDGRIAGVGPEYTKALECYDLAGQYILSPTRSWRKYHVPAFTSSRVAV